MDDIALLGTKTIARSEEEGQSISLRGTSLEDFKLESTNTLPAPIAWMWESVRVLRWSRQIRTGTFATAMTYGNLAYVLTCNQDSP